MQKIASKMQLKAGHLEEYRRRHDQLWPELTAQLRSVGIEDYSIHHDPDTNVLSAVMWCRTPEKLSRLAGHHTMKRWWACMAPLMHTNASINPP